MVVMDIGITHPGLQSPAGWKRGKSSETVGKEGTSEPTESEGATVEAGPDAATAAVVWLSARSRLLLFCAGVTPATLSMREVVDSGDVWNRILQSSKNSFKGPGPVPGSSLKRIFRNFRWRSENRIDSIHINANNII
jgi:hypothetical protein